MAYADYAFYTDTFYGNVIEEEDFPRLASRASDFIDYYTMGKAAKVEADDVALLVSKACCAIAEEIQRLEIAAEIARKASAAALAGEKGEYKSESVGAWSVSYATSGDYSGSLASMRREAQEMYAKLAFQYLANTGLLYRGLAGRCGCCGCE